MSEPGFDRGDDGYAEVGDVGGVDLDDSQGEFDDDAEGDVQRELPPDDEPDLLLGLGAAIGDPDSAAADSARTHLNGEDQGGFGRLGEVAVWWASVRAAAQPYRALQPRRVLLAGGGTDVATRRPEVRALALPRGGTVEQAIRWGIDVADRAADDGTDLILLTLDTGAPWRVLAADLLGLDVVEASSWPEDRGLSDEQWMDEVANLRDQLHALRGLRSMPCELLRALGSPPVAAAAALLIAATARRTPLLLDGPGAAAVALMGVRVHYAAPNWWQAAHLGTDRLHERMLGSLGLEALTRLDIRRTDGTAALAGLAVLDAAAALLQDPSEDTDADAG